MIRLLLLGLALASPTFAQTYDFIAAPAGIGAAGGFAGSFDYLSGAITHFSWDGSWSEQPAQGNALSFINGEGDILSTTLFAPLGGQSAITSDFVISFAVGGSYGFCGGNSGFCDSGPIVFTATTPVGVSQQAPEIGGTDAPIALTLLFGALAVIRGRVKP